MLSSLSKGRGSAIGEVPASMSVSEKFQISGFISPTNEAGEASSIKSYFRDTEVLHV